MPQRINWIDYAKVIGIYLVVLGHLPIPEQGSVYIYSFHMPLFFFISGFLSKTNNITFRQFILKKIRTLIIPYIIFSIGTYIFWVAIGRHFGSDADVVIPLYKPAIGILYGTTAHDYMIHNIPLWFIPCLFIVEMLWYGLQKLSIHIILLLCVCSIIGYIFPQLTSIRLPWGIEIAFTAIVFYGIGNIIQQKNLLQIFHSNITYITVIIISILVFIIGNKLQGRVDLNSLEFKNPILFYLTACSGIFILQTISKYIPNNSIISFISNHTLTILALHGLSISVIKACMIFVFHIPIETINNTIGLNSIVALFAIIILIPCMIVFEKYMPIVIGKQKT